MRLYAKTVRKIAAPGKIAIHQENAPPSLRAWLSMPPQLGSCTSPSPRKLRTLSVRIAAATPKLADTSTGATPLGSMWRKMTDRRGSPAATAACTKSCLRSRRNSARTNRALLVHPVSPMIAIIR
jgi:hypothetical protein